MKICQQCGKEYPDEFLYCPIDGITLEGNPSNIPQTSTKQPAQIRVRTMILGFSILVLCAAMAFFSAFLYQYWKPKYGRLTIETTPGEAVIFVDGQSFGVSPLNIPRLRSGEHEIRIVREGYKDFVQMVTVVPYTYKSLPCTLEPITPQLSNEQLAEIREWRKKLGNAFNENILWPPPEDYNVLYFADKILAIDPTDAQAIEARSRLETSVRRLADIAYARENWLEAERQYKKLTLLFPDDPSIAERMEEIAAGIEAVARNREDLIKNWQAQAEAAIKAGRLTPPDNDNAFDAVQNIQRLEKNNAYARETFARIRDALQNRGDNKIKASDWQGARNDFSRLLQYFPDDRYGKARLAEVDAKLAETSQPERRADEAPPARKPPAALRQSALEAFRSGDYPKAIAAWQEYLKLEPGNDEAWFYIGASYQNQKQWDAAIANFEKCIALNPRNILAHLNVGLLYDHSNNFKAAEEHLSLVRELGGADQYTPERLQTMIQELRERARVQEITKLSVPVEHKHALSNCRGTLHFSEDGLEFRTAETDHGFYESYKGMQGFVIEKNMLTIKTSRNKKYNFRFLNLEDAERIRKWSATYPAIPVNGKVD